MAKNKNEEYDEEFDSGLDDFDTDMDFGDFDSLEPKKIKNDRTPLITGIEAAASSFKDKVTDPETLLKATKKALPDSFNSTIDVGDKIITNTTRLIDDVAKDLKGPVKQFKRSARAYKKTLGDVLPKGLSDWIDKKLEDTEDSGQQSYSEEQLQEAALQNTLLSIFKKQQEQDLQNRNEEKVQTMMGIEQQNRTLDVSSKLLSKVTVLADYQEQIGVNYQMKSLEYQIRSYNVLTGIAKTLNEYNQIGVSELKAITKNTSLPDLVKQQNMEVMKDVGLRRLAEIAGKHTGNIIGLPDIDETFKKMSDKIKEKLQDPTKELLEMVSTLIDTTLSMEDLSAMSQDVVYEENDKQKLGRKVGGLAGGSLGSLVLNKFAALLKKKLGDTETIQEYDHKIKEAIRTSGIKFNQFAKHGFDDADLPENASTSDKFLHYLKMGANKGREFFGFDELGKSDRIRTVTLDNEENKWKVAEFNNFTQKSITEIIPGFLARILRSSEGIRTGELPELVKYDYGKNAFVDKTELKRTIVNQFAENGGLRGYRDTIKDSIEVLVGKDNVDKLTEDQRSRLVRQLQKTMMTKDTVFNIEDIFSGKWSSDIEIDDDIQSLIKAHLSSLGVTDKTTTSNLVSDQNYDKDKIKNIEKVYHTLASAQRENNNIDKTIFDMIKIFGDDAVEVFRELGYLSTDSRNNHTINNKKFTDDYIVKDLGNQKTVDGKTKSYSDALRDQVNQNTDTTTTPAQQRGSFNTGGYTGQGGKNDIAGKVHRGEYVLTKEAVERLGVPFLDLLNYSKHGLPDIKNLLIALESKEGKLNARQLKKRQKKMGGDDLPSEDPLYSVDSHLSRLSTIEEHTSHIRNIDHVLQSWSDVLKSYLTTATETRSPSLGQGKETENPEGSQLERIDESINYQTSALMSVLAKINSSIVKIGQYNTGNKEITFDTNDLIHPEELTTDLINWRKLGRYGRTGYNWTKDRITQAVGFASKVTKGALNLFNDYVAKPLMNTNMSNIGNELKQDLYKIGANMMEPLISAKKMAEGVYCDAEGKVIKGLSELRGNLYEWVDDPNNPGQKIIQWVCSHEDIHKNLVDALGRRVSLNRLKDIAADTWKSLKHHGTNFAKFVNPLKRLKQLSGVAGNVYKRIEEQFILDIYVKGEDKPRITARELQEGVFYCNGKPLHRAKDIVDDVYDKDGNVWLSFAECKDPGIVDRYGRPYKDVIDRAISTFVIQPALAIGKGIKKGWDFFKAFGSKITGAFAHVFKGFSFSFEVGSRWTKRIYEILVWKFGGRPAHHMQNIENDDLFTVPENVSQKIKNAKNYVKQKREDLKDLRENIKGAKENIESTIRKTKYGNKLLDGFAQQKNIIAARLREHGVDFGKYNPSFIKDIIDKEFNGDYSKENILKAYNKYKEKSKDKINEKGGFTGFVKSLYNETKESAKQKKENELKAIADQFNSILQNKNTQFLISYIKSSKKHVEKAKKFLKAKNSDVYKSYAETEEGRMFIDALHQAIDKFNFSDTKLAKYLDEKKNNISGKMEELSQTEMGKRVKKGLDFMKFEHLSEEDKKFLGGEGKKFWKRLVKRNEDGSLDINIRELLSLKNNENSRLNKIKNLFKGGEKETGKEGETLFSRISNRTKELKDDLFNEDKRKLKREERQRIREEKRSERLKRKQERIEKRKEREKARKEREGSFFNRVVNRFTGKRRDEDTERSSNTNKGLGKVGAIVDKLKSKGKETPGGWLGIAGSILLGAASLLAKPFLLAGRLVTKAVGMFSGLIGGAFNLFKGLFLGTGNGFWGKVGNIGNKVAKGLWRAGSWVARHGAGLAARGVMAAGGAIASGLGAVGTAAGFVGGTAVVAGGAIVATALIVGVAVFYSAWNIWKNYSEKLSDLDGYRLASYGIQPYDNLDRSNRFRLLEELMEDIVTVDEEKYKVQNDPEVDYDKMSRLMWDENAHGPLSGELHERIMIPRFKDWYNLRFKPNYITFREAIARMKGTVMNASKARGNASLLNLNALGEQFSRKDWNFDSLLDMEDLNNEYRPLFVRLTLQDPAKGGDVSRYNYKGLPFGENEMGGTTIEDVIYHAGAITNNPEYIKAERESAEKLHNRWQDVKEELDKNAQEQKKLLEEYNKLDLNTDKGKKLAKIYEQQLGVLRFKEKELRDLGNVDEMSMTKDGKYALDTVNPNTGKIIDPTLLKNREKIQQAIESGNATASDFDLVDEEGKVLDKENTVLNGEDTISLKNKKTGEVVQVQYNQVKDVVNIGREMSRMQRMRALAYGIDKPILQDMAIAMLIMEKKFWAGNFVITDLADVSNNPLGNNTYTAKLMIENEKEPLFKEFIDEIYPVFGHVNQPPEHKEQWIEYFKNRIVPIMMEIHLRIRHSKNSTLRQQNFTAIDNVRLFADPNDRIHVMEGLTQNNDVIKLYSIGEGFEFFRGKIVPPKDHTLETMKRQHESLLVEKENNPMLLPQDEVERRETAALFKKMREDHERNQQAKKNFENFGVSISEEEQKKNNEEIMMKYGTIPQQDGSTNGNNTGSTTTNEGTGGSTPSYGGTEGPGLMQGTGLTSVKGISATIPQDAMDRMRQNSTIKTNQPHFNKKYILPIIKEIGEKLGVNPIHLAGIATRESGLNPFSKAVGKPGGPPVTAGGLFQFTRDSWGQMLQTHGHKYGIEPTPANTDGSKYKFADDQRRFDPYLNTIMGAEMYKESYNTLVKAGIANPTLADIYALHFLGQSGGKLMLKAAMNTPNRPFDGLYEGTRGAIENNLKFLNNNRNPTVSQVKDAVYKKVYGDSLFQLGMDSMKSIMGNSASNYETSSVVNVPTNSISVVSGSQSNPAQTTPEPTSTSGQDKTLESGTPDTGYANTTPPTVTSPHTTTSTSTVTGETSTATQTTQSSTQTTSNQITAEQQQMLQGSINLTKHTTSNIQQPTVINTGVPAPKAIKAARWLKENDNKMRHEPGHARQGQFFDGDCAKAVRIGLAKGGYTVNPKGKDQGSAFMYHTNGILKDMGWTHIATNNSNIKFQTGDIIVWNAHGLPNPPGSKKAGQISGGGIHGHIQMYCEDGKWRSYKAQSRIDANPLYISGNKGFWVYRDLQGGKVPDMSEIQTGTADTPAPTPQQPVQQTSSYSNPQQPMSGYGLAAMQQPQQQSAFQAGPFAPGMTSSTPSTPPTVNTTPSPIDPSKTTVGSPDPNQTGVTTTKGGKLGELLTKATPELIELGKKHTVKTGSHVDLESMNQDFMKLFYASIGEYVKMVGKIRPFEIYSANRTYAYQKKLYEENIKKKGKDDGYVAKPGRSRHNFGVALDITAYAKGPSKGAHADFETGPLADWEKKVGQFWGFHRPLRYGKVRENWHVENKFFKVNNGVLKVDDMTSTMTEGMPGQSIGQQVGKNTIPYEGPIASQVDGTASTPMDSSTGGMTTTTADDPKKNQIVALSNNISALAAGGMDIRGQLEAAKALQTGQQVQTPAVSPSPTGGNVNTPPVDPNMVSQSTNPTTPITPFAINPTQQMTQAQTTSTHQTDVLSMKESERLLGEQVRLQKENNDLVAKVVEILNKQGTPPPMNPSQNTNKVDEKTGKGSLTDRGTSNPASKPTIPQYFGPVNTSRST